MLLYSLWQAKSRKSSSHAVNQALHFLHVSRANARAWYTEGVCLYTEYIFMYTEYMLESFVYGIQISCYFGRAYLS